MNIKLSSWLIENVNLALVQTPVVIYVPSDAGIMPLDNSGTGGSYDGGEVYVNSYAEYYGDYVPHNDYYGDYVPYSDYYGDYYDDYYGDYYDYGNYSNYFNTVTIASSPVSQTIDEGQTATFSFGVNVGSSVGNKAYQWYYSTTENGSKIKIAGATSSTYTVTGSVVNDGRYYFCEFTSNSRNVTSSRALLTVRITRAYDVFIAVGQKCQIPIATNYSASSSPTIVVVDVGNSSLLSATSDGMLTGIATGTTDVTVSVDGITKVVSVAVIDHPLQALFQTIAGVLRAKNDSNDSYHPSVFAAEIAKTITSFAS